MPFQFVQVPFHFMSTSDVEADRSVSKAQEAGTDSETARAMRKGEPEKP